MAEGLFDVRDEVSGIFEPGVQTHHRADVTLRRMPPFAIRGNRHGEAFESTPRAADGEQFE